MSKLKTASPPKGKVVAGKWEIAIESHLGGFENLSANWSSPKTETNGHIGEACSSDSVSCAPTPKRGQSNPNKDFTKGKKSNGGL